MIRVKEARQPVTRRDGVRVLVERGWPRQLKKSEGAITTWLRALAPSPALRRWAQGHDEPAKGKHLSMGNLASASRSGRAAPRRQNPPAARPAALAPRGAGVRSQIFRKRYFQELTQPEATAALQQLHRLADSARDLTLVYSARAARPAAPAGSAAKKNSLPAKPGAAKSRAGGPGEFANHATVLQQLLQGLPKPPLSSGPEKTGSGRKNRAAASR